MDKHDFLTRCVMVTVVFALCAMVGCSNAGPDQPSAESTAMESSSAAAADIEKIIPPKFETVAVFVDLGDYTKSDGSTGKSGCSTTFTPGHIASNVKIDQGMTCGHPGAVSRVSWQYLQTSAEGDHYRFERIFPLDEPDQTTETKEVIYQGEELLVFKDAKQSIGIRPDNTK